MLHQKIKSEIPAAMKSRDRVRVDTLRGLVAAFTNELVATKRKPTEEFPDEDALGVVRREIKKRKEATEAFRKGSREESAQKEEIERAILEAYLPPQMSAEDIQKIVTAKKVEMNVMDKKDMGRLIGAVMKEVSGKADSEVVKTIVANSLE